MVAQPHRYRCETCTYFKLHEPERSEFADCLHPMNKDDPFMREIQGYEYDRIEKMGCCSHSQHESAEQRIADVIKELEERKESLKIFTVGREAGLRLGYEAAIALLREGK